MLAALERTQVAHQHSCDRDVPNDGAATVPGAYEICETNERRELPEAGETHEAYEVRDLSRALRASRLRLRRSALQSARQLIALNAEISHLQLLCERQAQQIARYAAGTVVMDMGRKLMTLSEANERLLEDSRRAAVLERVLGISEAERQRLTRERDAMARELARLRRDTVLGTHLTGTAHA